MSRGWIGVDLDGTLARYDGCKGAEHIGEPVPAMVDRVKRWLAEGREVRIFTARVCKQPNDPTGLAVRLAREIIERYCEKHIGRRLPVTNEKDFDMLQFWDDRAIQVRENTGEPVGATL